MSYRQRIQRDRERLAHDPPAKALLDCLEQHLFDPDLDVTYLGQTCKAPREVRDRLAKAVGMPLKAYINELRMMAAARLVLDTDLQVPQIGRRVGIPVVRSFNRTFSRVRGTTPSKMRKVARAAKTEPAPEAASDDGDDSLTTRARAARLRRQAVLGLLDGRRTAERRRQLRRRYPSLEEPVTPTSRAAEEDPSVILLGTGDHLEEVAADAVYWRILSLPTAAEVRHAFLNVLRIGNSVGFKHLHLINAQLAPGNRDLALWLGEVVVQVLEANSEILGDETADWRALSWAYLGRIRVLAGEPGGADQALIFAAAEERDAGRPLAPWAEAEIRRVEGMLRMRQRRDREAVGALDRAVALSRRLERLDPDRAGCVLERLELASLLGQAEAGLELAAELEALVDHRAGRDGDHNALWRGFVAFHRAKAHAAAGDDRRAAGHLDATDACLGTGGCAGLAVDLAVLGTFVVRERARLAGRAGRLDEYERQLRSAARRFDELGASVWAAAMEAEQAAVCALLGRRAEARELAARAAAFLEDLPFHREAWTAARKLRALADGDRGTGTPGELLDALRRGLDRVVWEITAVEAAAVEAAS